MLVNERSDVNRQGKSGFPQSGPMPAAIRKTERAGMPYRGVFRLPLQRVQSNLRETGVRRESGGRGKASLRWPGASLHGLMKDLDTRIESLDPSSDREVR